MFKRLAFSATCRGFDSRLMAYRLLFRVWVGMEVTCMFVNCCTFTKRDLQEGLALFVLRFFFNKDYKEKIFLSWVFKDKGTCKSNENYYSDVFSAYDAKVQSRYTSVDDVLFIMTS